MAHRPQVTIFRATPGDSAELAALFDAYRGFYGRETEVARCEVFLHDRLTRGESVVFLARAGGGGAPAIGFTQLYPIFTSVGLGRVWHLNDLYVREDARRSGAGRALMLHAIAFAKQDGAIRLTLETQVTNTPARRLYESLGMTQGTEFTKYGLKFD
jgi:ribosomal protein S18 acetylase RimI-like enzyme